MAEFVKGDVVIIPFPFSDFTQVKRRPALVLSTLYGDDLILCQITSQITRDSYTIAITDNDFETGSLKQPSNIRPNRIFTADRKLILYRIGNLKKDVLGGIIDKVIEIIRHYDTSSSFSPLLSQNSPFTLRITHSSTSLIPENQNHPSLSILSNVKT